jgi:hypothetical protein
MKQLLLTLLSITVIGFTQFAQNGTKKPVGNNSSTKINVHRPQRSANYEWNATSWSFIDSSYYQYNSQGQKISAVNRSNGTYTTRLNVTYDYLYRLILEVWEVYDAVSSTWKPNYKHQVDYNGLGDITLDERSNYSNGSWHVYLGEKNIYQYNTSNQITEITQYSFIDNTIGYRENIRFSDFVYDTDNNVLERVLSGWNNNQFVFFEKQTQTYNPDNSVDVQLTYSWNTGSNSWDHDFRYTFSYGTNGSYESLAESYALGSYQTAFKHFVDFDTHDNLTRDVVESWDDFNNIWTVGPNDLINVYSYDQNDYMTQETNRYMSYADTIYYSRRDYFDFETYDSHLGLESNEAELISIYPNPMETTAVIDLSGLEERAQNVTLFNAAGSKVLSIPAVDNQPIILTHEQLQSGFYQVVIETDTRVIQSRIIVE